MGTDQKLSERPTRWEGIGSLLKQNQSLLKEGIDTDEEWEPVGRIPEEKLKLRSSRSQEVGKSTMGHTENPRFECGANLAVSNSIRRYLSGGILEKRHGSVLQREKMHP